LFYRLFPIVFLVGTLFGCAGETEHLPTESDLVTTGELDSGTSSNDATNAEVYEGPGTPLGWEAQREGDPEVGYQVLLDGNYVGCGIPYRVYELAKELDYIPGGTPAPGGPPDIPYYLSVAKEVADIDLVSPNCLTCHAGTINGELVIGLGSTDLDYTSFSSGLAGIDQNMINLLDELFGLSETEFTELTKFTTRTQAIQAYVTPRTAGVNPADNLAAILFAHRDQDTLAWSDEPLMEPPPKEVVPLDVPPWWRMKKKSSMLYIGAGRGDHARIMMTASTLCIDSVDEAKKIDATMPDLRAYILSLEAPIYPWETDPSLVQTGEAIFGNNCSGCHGTYGEDETYPNLVIPVDEVGTDPALVAGASQFAARFVDWFNNSFYGEIANLAPQDGYVPPPLDGIWATPPFLHNGSVPTLEALLDSSKRPTYWQRSFNSMDYNQTSVGWHYEEVAYGQDAEPDPDKRRFIYDTTLYGYGNAGHTYGDHLSDDERKALIEYLKTL
jgi:mono/diheme cytochrome c family protein